LQNLNLDPQPIQPTTESNNLKLGKLAHILSPKTRLKRRKQLQLRAHLGAALNVGLTPVESQQGVNEEDRFRPSSAKWFLLTVEMGTAFANNKTRAICKFRH
jgi:hypothetical protein